MGRYIDWDDVVDRYPELNSLGGADELSSSYVVYAESFVDGILRSHYLSPFSGTNMVVKDLAIDACYWKAAGRKLDDATSVWSNFHMTVDLLKKGHLTMVDETGTVIEQINQTPAVYSSTQSYHSSFGMDDPINWGISLDNQEADEDSRS